MRWLRKDHSVVITEMSGATSEEADAIGWGGYDRTTLIECKAYRSDFLSDRKKPFRQRPSLGMGSFRYYLCPKGLISEEEVPEGWGLLWESNRRVFRKVPAPRQPEKNQRGETNILLSLIRRIGRGAPPGTSVNFYTYETKNRATAGVDLREDEP
jgi:hypothetical protein